MKDWYYTTNLSDTRKQKTFRTIDEAVSDAIRYILCNCSLTQKTRCTINLYDYPPCASGTFGDAIHIFEFNVMK